jgi:8-oxo-dGTP pyrophosphatase MutT (NUDIX family)
MRRDGQSPMNTDRPGPEQPLNLGPSTEPRPAGTVILLRGGDRALEVLLVRRNPGARFMGGAWVFPGGAVNRREGHGDEALRAAAIRELEEEASIAIDDPAELVAFSRWITPAEVKIRFDTWFFLAPEPAGAEARPDGSEVVDARWYAPAEALDARRRGELFLVFPTMKHLEQLSAFGSADELLAHTRGREIHPVQPRVVQQGETARIVLPGEPGYAD